MLNIKTHGRLWKLNVPVTGITADNIVAVLKLRENDDEFVNKFSLEQQVQLRLVAALVSYLGTIDSGALQINDTQILKIHKPTGPTCNICKHKLNDMHNATTCSISIFTKSMLNSMVTVVGGVRIA